MSIDLLSPQNDTLILGYNYSSFTDRIRRITSGAINLMSIQQTVNSINNRVIVTDKNASDAVNNYKDVVNTLGSVSGGLEVIAGVVTENARNIAINAENIPHNADDIEDIKSTLESVLSPLTALKS
jgi:hypothetical protein